MAKTGGLTLKQLKELVDQAWEDNPDRRDIEVVLVDNDGEVITPDWLMWDDETGCWIITEDDGEDDDD